VGYFEENLRSGYYFFGIVIATAYISQVWHHIDSHKRNRCKGKILALIDYTGIDGDEYHKIRHQELFNNPALIDAWGQFAHLTYFPNIQTGERLLEVGCGLGNNLVNVRKMVETYATEPAPAARDFAKTLGINAVPSVDDLPVGLQFHYILLRHVLEHVPEPHAFLHDLHGRLLPGGKIILVLPTESPFSPADPGDLNHHLYCWNRQTISNLLADTNYTAIETRLSWHNGRRILLPLYKKLGAKSYQRAIQLFGKITKTSEIIAVATL